MIAGLTKRQSDVAELVAIGHSDKSIAAKLCIDEETVNYHIRKIVDRLALDRSLNSRVQITRRVLAAAQPRERDTTETGSIAA